MHYASASPVHMQHQHSNHSRDVLTAAYENVMAQLVAASTVVSGIASSLAGPSDGQTDTSARLCGRAGRCTGKKRKLSPCVYDYSETLGFHAASNARADTPTQELLPASRSELRTTQLQAVRWLASLQRAGASGVLADELEADRRAEVAGLLAHLAATPPEPEDLPAGAAGFAAGAASGSGGGLAAAAAAAPVNACLLLAPTCSLGSWREVICGGVMDVAVHLHDGAQPDGGAAALMRAAAASVHVRAGAAAASAGHNRAQGLGQPACGGAAAAAPGGRRSACGGACPPAGGSGAAGGGGGGSSAAGVFPPAGSGYSLQHQPYHPHQQQHQTLHPFQPHPAGGGAGPTGGAGAGPNAGLAPPPVLLLLPPPPPQLLVVLAPLEHLPRDVGLLSHLPARLTIVDLAPASAHAHVQQHHQHQQQQQQPFHRAGGGSDGGADDEFSFRLGPVGGGGSGSGGGAAGGSGSSSGGAGCGGGMDLESYSHLHLLTRMPAASRVLLSAGEPEPASLAGSCIWLLLQLLAPNTQQPLWRSVSELQTALLAACSSGGGGGGGGGGLGEVSKEEVLADVHGRLWALLRPLVLARRARDVDLSCRRAAATSLNLFDHFSSVRGDS
ncbi:hypothetical protein HXX76_015178 [Chlamydomonas incerta]|uniref:Uncharacterized protein n=1 Tax=Chlamydomonas incerta TaxID=51695 RepID=A0A835SDR1_CHLIN|nr:hypothetical protein HXX76_015178 [Chlamydomonas incerta]|eukprot:KAG2423661.1 hypothetical protein HXX76_015178 [Chlamydomonas incerta]